MLARKLIGAGGHGGGLGPAPTLTFRTSSATAENNTTYSFTSLGIGTASADRYVVAVCAAHAGTSGGLMSNFLINGSAASDVFNPGNTRTAAIIGGLVTSGTTCSIGFDCTSGLRAAVAIYTITGLASYSFRDTDSVTAPTSNTLAIDLLEDGVVITGADVSGNITFTLSGATIDAQFAYADENDTGAAGSYQGAAETGRVLTWGGGGSGGYGVAVSLR